MDWPDTVDWPDAMGWPGSPIANKALAETELLPRAFASPSPIESSGSSSVMLLAAERDDQAVASQPPTARTIAGLTQGEIDFDNFLKALVIPQNLRMENQHNKLLRVQTLRMIPYNAYLWIMCPNVTSISTTDCVYNPKADHYSLDKWGLDEMGLWNH